MRASFLEAHFHAPTGKFTSGVGIRFSDGSSQQFAVLDPLPRCAVTLTHEEGLPAGLAEVEMIDRIRRRRDVELSLPQVHGRVCALVCFRERVFVSIWMVPSFLPPTSFVICCRLLFSRLTPPQ